MRESVSVRLRVAYGDDQRLAERRQEQARRRSALLAARPDLDPDAEGLGPREVRLRRARRRAHIAELRRTGAIADTDDLLMAAGVRAELMVRGWWWRTWPAPGPDAPLGGRWPGAPSTGYPAAVYMRLPAVLARTVTAACWTTSAPAIAELRAWRETHPRLTSRREDPGAWAAYDALAAEVTTPGDLYRAALDRVLRSTPS